jgi:hypothetical protein
MEATMTTETTSKMTRRVWRREWISAWAAIGLATRTTPTPLVVLMCDREIARAEQRAAQEQARLAREISGERYLSAAREWLRTAWIWPDDGYSCWSGDWRSSPGATTGYLSLSQALESQDPDEVTRLVHAVRARLAREARHAIAERDKVLATAREKAARWDAAHEALIADLRGAQAQGVVSPHARAARDVAVALVDACAVTPAPTEALPDGRGYRLEVYA